MSSHLNEIIKKLGYTNSLEFLMYKRDGNYDTANLNAQTIKVLNILSPFATYTVNNEPFILFFDEPSDSHIKKDMHKKVWNAQIPVAIFCSATTVTIYSGYTIDTKSYSLQLAETLEFNTIDENSPFSFWDITSQNFWMQYSQQFSGRKLSRELLDNLIFLTNKLRDTHKIPFATNLVLRLIFIRYLIDRNVDLDYVGFSQGVEKSKEALLVLLKNKENLYALFSHLKSRFNGNLFEIESNEFDLVTDSVLDDMYNFLSARVHSPSGQLSLFDLYDFAIIPVELISSIFEILLGEKDRAKDNAFYTPKYLVDYILNMTIDEHIEINNTCKILDPSCGSGVFLVDSYRRMVEKALCGKLYMDDENDDLLRSILTDNIYGIDLNPQAIDVAIFSLYLAMLDYKNPRSLDKFQLPDLKKGNLIECDFFDVERLVWLQEKSFDFIIGNPPWGSKHGKHVDYCKENGHMKYMQNNDTCRSFILRSQDFCKENRNVKCCFVLHSKLLYMRKQRSIDFREFLLTRTKIINLIELSSVRELVFAGADAPAIVLSYSFSNEQTLENRFNYISMKKNEFFKCFNIIVAEKVDIKSVQQRLLKDNDWAWKTLVYGLTGDIDIIRRLKESENLLGDDIRKQRPAIILGAGVEYHDGDKNDASHLVGRQLLDSDTSIEHFTLFENYMPFSKLKIHRPRKEALFHAPYCLVKTGLDMSDYTMRAVYAETDFVFHKAIYAIKGSIDQKPFLLSVTGLLNSSLYAYFNLMLGSSLGVEREQRQMREVFEFPFIFNDDIATQVELIQSIKMQRDFGSDTDASVEINTLNQTIFDAFGLSDNKFVDYALQIQIPQLTGKNNENAIRTVNPDDLKAYAKDFYDYLRPIFEVNNMYVKVVVYPTVVKHYSAVEVIILESNPDDWFIISNEKADRLKEMLTRFSSHKINERFYVLKDVLHFEENSFCIIKPNSYKNWHPAIAMLDIMEVIDQILSRKIGGDN